MAGSGLNINRRVPPHSFNFADAQQRFRNAQIRRHEVGTRCSASSEGGPCDRGGGEQVPLTGRAPSNPSVTADSQKARAAEPERSAYRVTL